MVRNRVVSIFLVLVVAMGVDVLAAPTLDQSHLGGGTLRDTIYGNRQLAQTFTVGLAGTLDSIELDLYYRRGAPTQAITVDVRGTTNGLPNGATQGFGSVQFDTSVLTTTFMLYSIDFSSFSIPVAVGDQLAIVLTSADDYSNAADWHQAYSNPYPGGRKYNDLGTAGATWDTKDYDAYFQTYVETEVQPGQESGVQVIPAPAGLHLVVVGLAYLARQRRKLW